MLQADVTQLRADITLLPVHTCTQWRYITVLCYMSVLIFTHQRINNTLKRKASEDIDEWPWKLISNELTPELLEILSVDDVVHL